MSIIHVTFPSMGIIKVSKNKSDLQITFKIIGVAAIRLHISVSMQLCLITLTTLCITISKLLYDI